MSLSVKLYMNGKVGVNIYGLCEDIPIIEKDSISKLRYIATDFDAMCNGKEVSVDIYENSYGEYFGVVNW